MRNGLKKQKLENQKSKQYQKRNNVNLIKSIFVFMGVAASVFVAATFLFKENTYREKSEIRIGVTAGVPHIIGKCLQGIYGEKAVKLEDIMVYDFQDC